MTGPELATRIRKVHGAGRSKTEELGCTTTETYMAAPPANSSAFLC